MEQQLCLQSPRLQVPITVWQKMMAYIINCPTEINGFGLVEQINSDLFFLRDVFITEQVASPTHVENDPMVLSQMMTNMLRNGQNPSEIKFQWHSHVAMQAYFSSTDTANIDNWPGDWLISVVANKYGEYQCRLDTFKGVRLGVELKPELVATIAPDIMATTATEIAQKVRRPPGIIRARRSVSDGKPSTASTLVIGDPDLDVRFDRSRQ